jgi:hypothetical protein
MELACVLFANCSFDQGGNVNEHEENFNHDTPQSTSAEREKLIASDGESY